MKTAQNKSAWKIQNPCCRIVGPVEEEEEEGFTDTRHILKSPRQYMYVQKLHKRRSKYYKGEERKIIAFCLSFLNDGLKNALGFLVNT